MSLSEGRSQQLYREAKSIIPGGTQLLSKRPEMFAPDQWPAYFQRAAGCEVTDLDGREYLDFTHNGVGSCLLGYAHPQVVNAVVNRVQNGSMSSLNSPEEVWLSRELIALHPWADQVRLGRCGGEAMAIAARIARASTGRDVIAFCGYHGWSDWYLAANLNTDKALDGHLLPGLSPSGIPRGLQGTALPFVYNSTEELRAIVEQHGKNLAAVIMEPTRNMQPKPGFLESVRELSDSCGACLVFDEVTTGFRFRPGGIHPEYGVEPDIAVFAKALGNGHPIAAVIGKARIMEAAQRSFISSTYWTEGVGPAAALATIEVCRTQDVAGHVRRIGEQFQAMWRQLAVEFEVPVQVGGYPALTTISFQHPQSAALLTLLTVRMLAHGILAGGGFYPTFAHQSEHIARYRSAAEAILPEIGAAIQMNNIESLIGGPVRHTGFARLT
ncbi:MAG: aminotransferase class III-fold pyridoxal phosphate-dependent enzyme [Planctomyces sp.]|nr:aminotransferase class III-fold pyridoxal phosphate-dependent enzyme [Planctomyces sp.]